MTAKKFTVITLAAVGMITAAILSAQYLLNRQEMNLTVGTDTQEDNSEPLPYIDADTGALMIPLRRVVDQMGGIIEWNESYNSVVISYNDIVLEIVLNGSKGTINGNNIIFDTNFINKNGILYVTADFVSTYLNTDVKWNETSDEITIITNALNMPVVSYNAFENKGTINGYYVTVPVITDLVDKNYEKQLNMSLNTQLMNEISLYSQTALEQYKEDAQNPKRYINWEYKSQTSFRSSEFISIMSNSKKTTLDGTESIEKKSVNIDLQSQKFVTLSDMFKSNEFLNIYAEKYDSFDYDIEKGSFYINNDSLVLYMNNPDGTITEYSQELFMLKKYLKTEYHVLIKY